MEQCISAKEVTVNDKNQHGQKRLQPGRGCQGMEKPGRMEDNRLTDEEQTVSQSMKGMRPRSMGVEIPMKESGQSQHGRYGKGGGQKSGQPGTGENRTGQHQTVDNQDDDKGDEDSQ